MLKEKLKELYLAGESTSSLAKKFNLRSDEVWRSLVKQGVKIRSHSASVKLALEKGRLKVRQHQISDSRLIVKKAYLLGVLCGDGWIWYCTKPPHQTYQFGLQAADEDFVDEFRKCVYSTYALKTSKRFIAKRKTWRRPQFESRICSKAVCNDLRRYLPRHKTRTWRVPREIKIADLVVKAAFIRGFFDSEGHLDVRRIGATSINLCGLNDLKLLLQDFGIRAEIQGSENRAYQLRIQDRNSVEVYASKIGFTIERKSLALQKMLATYKLRLSLRENVAALEPEIKRLRTEGMTYREISKKLGVSVGTIWNHYKH